MVTQTLFVPSIHPSKQWTPLSNAVRKALLLLEGKHKEINSGLILESGLFWTATTSSGRFAWLTLHFITIV